jgi:hypothetical protein
MVRHWTSNVFRRIVCKPNYQGENVHIQTEQKEEEEKEHPLNQMPLHDFYLSHFEMI